MVRHAMFLFWVLCGCATAGDDDAPPEIDPRRSLMITDEEILARFELERVMTALATEGVDGPPRDAALTLFRQWWDTQNAAADAVGDGLHCDGETSDGAATFNGFPLTCPRSEGGQARVDPFDPSADNREYYVPIGISNRFDLATTDGRSCGQYRLLYAKRSDPAKFPNDRNLLIFEGGLPNPEPERGLEGCRPIAELVAELSSDDGPGRAERLERLFFTGVAGFAPVVRRAHYDGVIGHLRTNQFVAGDRENEPWTLKSFAVRTRPDGAAAIDPLVVENSPMAALFDPAATHPRAAAFREHFLTQVESLALPDLQRFHMRIDHQFLPGESISGFTGLLMTPLDESARGNYYAVFTAGAERDDGFRRAIQARLTALGSTLTPEHIVKRALALSCAGCHEISGGVPFAGDVPDPLAGIGELGDGLTWRGSSGFVHVTEEPSAREPAEDAGPRYGISNALREQFLPHRERVLERFLDGTLALEGSTDGTIGSLPLD